MSAILFDLDHNRNKLEYFTEQRNQALAALQAAGSRAKTTPYDKWIEIYSERVGKLERQVSRLGLKTQIGKTPVMAARA